MPRLDCLVAVACVVTCAALAPGAELPRYTGPVDAPDVVGGHVGNRVIVRLEPGTTARLARAGWILAGPGQDAGPRELALAALLEVYGTQSIAPTFALDQANATRGAKHRLDRYVTVQVQPGVDVRDLAAALNAFGAPIEVAELDGIGGVMATVPSDPSFGLQYGMNNTGQTVNGLPGTPDADIDLPEAWDLWTGTDAITIAIIDTGVSTSHPDLTPKLVPGWNTVSGSTNTDDSFLISHGSHCAGIAAASSNNGVGVAGVSWGAKIMPVKVLNFIGSGTETDIAEGLVWAADHGANVGSMSLGFNGDSSALEDAVNYANDAGMLLVAATGNTAGAPISAPAKYDVVLAVGATDNNDAIASFTSTGPEMDVTAPGVDVYSTWDVFFQSNTYAYQSGTSMACPHVAGLAALLWSIDPSRSKEEVRAIIEATAEDKGAPGFDPIFGHGRVNAFAAVSLALEPRCAAADLNCDGSVGGADLGILLAAWGGGGPADLTGDGVVDGADLGVLLAAFE